MSNAKHALPVHIRWMVPRVPGPDRAAPRARRAAKVRGSQPAFRHPRRPGGDPPGALAVRAVRAASMVVNPSPALPRLEGPLERVERAARSARPHRRGRTIPPRGLVYHVGRTGA
jgi:hypothetical protein